MKTGTVKWFDAKKGFGFICSDEGGPDYFFHHSAIQMKGFRSLNEGDRVEFDPSTEPNKKGPAAGKVFLVGSPRPLNLDQAIEPPEGERVYSFDRSTFTISSPGVEE